MKKILLVFGTRPEAIKMAPLVKELEKYPDAFDVRVCVTGQHREMLDQVTDLFEIIPDYDLDIMKKGQDLFDVTTKVLLGIKEVLSICSPDLVLVHGDTTTSMAASLACFYQKIPVGHVEAGLRTNNIYSPWPEELNRQITSRIATFHFAPTQLSMENLVNEGVSNKSVYITGNTVIDALYLVLNKMETNISLLSDIDNSIGSSGYNVSRLSSDINRKMVLITGHRRENFGTGFLNICKAIQELSLKFPSVDFVYPMHLNPNVREPINRVFATSCSKNIFFIEPLEYLQFVRLMSLSFIVLTDSGGIQEEAPGLGKPVLVMRNTTERPEAVIAGTVKLVGTDIQLIIKSVSDLLLDNGIYETMHKTSNPYGVGDSCKKIVDILLNELK